LGRRWVRATGGRGEVLPHGRHEELRRLPFVEVQERLLVTARDELLLDALAMHAVGVLRMGYLDLGQREIGAAGRVEAGGRDRQAPRLAG
jgi:hypothetical protein